MPLLMPPASLAGCGCLVSRGTLHPPGKQWAGGSSNVIRARSGVGECRLEG